MQQQYKPIHFIGPVGTLCDGYAHYNRAIIRMLTKFNYPLKVTSAEPGNNAAVPVSTDTDIINAIRSTKDLQDPDILINATVPPLYRKGPGINIGITTWETTILPTEWVNAINQLHALLVPSDGIKSVFKNSGVKVPMYTLKYPIDFKTMDTTQKVVVEPSIARRVTFMFSGNWIPRKNIEDLVFGYSQAFDSVPDVSLVIKTWATNNDAGSRVHIDNAIRHLCSKMSGVNRPKIHICTDQLEDTDLLKTISGCDVYVTTSRGEGGDSAAAIALAMGKLLICDTFLGHSDYTGNNVYNYRHSLRPVMDSGVGFHSSRMRWASPDFESLVQAYRLSYNAVVQNKKSNNIEIRYRNSDQNVFNTFVDTLNLIIARHEPKVPVGQR